MTIVALEFSSDRRAAAVVRDGKVLAEACVIGGRATSAPALIAEAMSRAGIGASEVDRLAVGVGPGSYTGIRRAIATLQGWHLARGTPVVPVGSFEVLASVAAESGIVDGWLAADAQRGEWAVAVLRGGKVSGEPGLKPVSEVEAMVQRGERVVTADVNLPGAVRLYPDAGRCGTIAEGREPVDPTLLAPVYLREAVFVKAKPVRGEFRE